MAHRLLAGVVTVAAVLAAAPAAHATLVYVKKPEAISPQVWVAEDDGSDARRVGHGHFPVISPDGKWIAWRDFERDGVYMRKTEGRNVRRIAHSTELGEVQFSPDSSRVGVVLRSRLIVYNIARRSTRTVAKGAIRGFSFSPDSRSVVFGTSGTNRAFDAPSDLYILALGEQTKTRVTRDRKSLNPLWGPDGEIVHDRQTPRPGDAPRFNLFAIHPDGGALRRVTALRIPSLLSGLVPLEMSADGSRMVASFVGQDTLAGFTVNPLTGRARALSHDFEHGFVASDLSANGRTVLGTTGGPDPTVRHNVVTMPYAGGKTKVLVRRAAEPDWTR